MNLRKLEILSYSISCNHIAGGLIMKLKLKDVLFMLGITPNYVAYKYLLRAVEMAREDENRLNCISKEIWEPLEAEYHYEPRGIESSIRTASRKAWRTNRGLLEELALQSLPLPPSAVEFLFILYRYETNDDIELSVPWKKDKEPVET